jgi:proline iminopeptidase
MKSQDKTLADILYPESEPYHVDQIKVSSLHTLHVQQHGNPKGKPVVFVHGGPGGAINNSSARYFNPKTWRIILFDQRGCGKSTPHASLKENTTWDLVNDMETIREHFKINSWTVFGGSWGTTLSLVYSITHPKRCENLVLRGIFLARQKDVDWLYLGGSGKFYPEEYQQFLKPLKTKNQRDDLIKSYYKLLTSEDKKTRIEAAKAWSIWEGSISQLTPEKEVVESFGGDEFAVAFARIECHYFINQCFLETENYILENTDKIKNIPCFIAHGRYDVICLPEQAWELHSALPKSELFYSKSSGHALSEVNTASQIVKWMDTL